MTEKTTVEVPFMEVNGELCKGCQLCIDVCPKSVIAISEKLNLASYHPAFYTGADCTGCGLCAADCPGWVLELKNKKAAFKGPPANCLECHHCVAICKVGAVSAPGTA